LDIATGTSGFGQMVIQRKKNENADFLSSPCFAQTNKQKKKGGHAVL
jgi:hypothetical protein